MFYFSSTIINCFLSRLHCEQKMFFIWSTDCESARLHSRPMSLTLNLWKHVLLFLTTI